MSKTYQYRPQGVCSQLMEITVNDGILEDLQVLGGCSGNLQGIASLVRGMKVEDIIPAPGRHPLRTQGHFLPRPAGAGAEGTAQRVKTHFARTGDRCGILLHRSFA